MTKGKPYYNIDDRSDDRYTPLWLFKQLNAIYHFETDPAADPTNRLGVKKFYTKNYNFAGGGGGLNLPWEGATFINPPYDRDLTSLWIDAAKKYVEKSGNYVVMLLNANTTSNQWFHKHLWNKEKGWWHAGVTVDFIEGRVHYYDINGKEMQGAPFGSMLVEFRKDGMESKLIGWSKINPEATSSRKLDEF